MNGLVIVETHPVQYHAPVWREAATLGVPLHVVYGSDFSVVNHMDQEFNARFQWDVDLRSGYPHTFQDSVQHGGAEDYESVRPIQLQRILESLTPSAVLILGYYHPYDRAALWWAHRKRIPLWFRGETSDVSDPGRSKWKSLLRDQVLRYIYRWFDIFLNLGTHSRNHYLRLGVPESKLLHSPYCVDTHAFQTDEAARDQLRRVTRAHWGIPDDAWVILYCGKLSRRKGIEHLTPAIHRLPVEVQRNTWLLLVGEGHDRHLIDTGLHPQVVFAGFQNQHQLSAFYHAADVLTLPSLSGETWGLVVNDALHHGLPVVTSDVVGCSPDLVVPGITGYTARHDDAAELANALLRSRELQGEACRHRCRKHVSDFGVYQAALGIVQAWQHSTIRRP